MTERTEKRENKWLSPTVILAVVFYALGMMWAVIGSYISLSDRITGAEGRIQYNSERIGDVKADLRDHIAQGQRGTP